MRCLFKNVQMNQINYSINLRKKWSSLVSCFILMPGSTKGVVPEAEHMILYVVYDIA